MSMEWLEWLIWIVLAHAWFRWFIKRCVQEVIDENFEDADDCPKEF